MVPSLTVATRADTTRLFITIGSPPGGSTLRCMVVLGDTRHPSSSRARLSETWRRRTGLPLMEMLDPSLIDALSPSTNWATACDMLELPLDATIISPRRDGRIAARSDGGAGRSRPWARRHVPVPLDTTIGQSCQTLQPLRDLARRQNDTP